MNLHQSSRSEREAAAADQGDGVAVVVGEHSADGGGVCRRWCEQLSVVVWAAVGILMWSPRSVHTINPM